MSQLMLFIIDKPSLHDLEQRRPNEFPLEPAQPPTFECVEGQLVGSSRHAFVFAVGLVCCLRGAQMLLAGRLLWSQLAENGSSLHVHLIRGRGYGYERTERGQEDGGGEDEKSFGRRQQQSYSFICN